jgi:hypothetical protein
MRRGAPQFGWDKIPVSRKAWISAVVAAGGSLIAAVVGIPLLRRKVERDMEEAAAAAKRCKRSGAGGLAASPVRAAQLHQ